LKVAHVEANRPDLAIIDEAARLIRRGGLVAFPTETVYGIGANALDAEAVAKIFAAKERPAYNPLIVHVDSISAAREVVRVWPEEAETLARVFWPGPLTLVLAKSRAIGPEVTAGLDTVAVRVPAHPVALSLLAAAAVPIAAPSANRFMRLSPTTAEHVLKGLEGRIDLVLDAGPTPVGIESTVLDLSRGRPILLRAGSVGKGSIEAVIGEEVGYPQAFSSGSARPAPGMLERHYAPQARLLLVRADDTEALNTIAEQAVGSSERVGALLLTIPTANAVEHVVRMPDDAAEYASRLYATLHQLDSIGCDLVLVEAVPPGEEWAGVRDRLTRAAASGTRT
jgi:L-threonylcarbamoyladenylate synthase